MSGTHLDITDRKQAQEALRESEEGFRSFFESAASGMAIIDPEGRTLRVNPTFCHLSGYSEAETLEMNILEMTHPDDREKTRHLYDEIRVGRRRVGDYEKRYLCKDGSVVWGHATVAGVFGLDGALRYFAANVQDITESKRAQDQVRESKQVLQLVLDYIPQHVFWKDHDSVYLGCNSNFARAAGVKKPQDLIGKTDYDLAWKREEADFFRECDRRVMETDTPEIHIIEPQLQASGKQAWLDTNKIPLHNGEGRVVGILGTFEDITERKLAEEELEAFAYTVSHDLRTPLTSMIGYADLLREICQDRLDEQALNCLAKIIASGEMMATLMDDLLTLATVGKVQSPVEALDTRKVVNEVVNSLSEQISRVGGGVVVGDLPVVQVSKTLLVQLFDNLLGNAIRYGCKPGDVIEVGGERIGERVSLYVRDHGPGIPIDERDRIFEVFFRGTIGKSQKGSGVGLATVQKIAKTYEGRTWVEETPGGGSTFWVEMVDIPTTAEKE
jgi:PAS domain S-box-containing protein